MSKPKIFILNDEAVQNSYGFFILTAGGKFDRFKSNPVMLSDHVNKNENVIGNWLNFEVKNNIIQAEPNFDKDRPIGLEIAGQVEREFIKGASMGILPNWDSLERVGDKLILKEWELVEASIVPVPSNRNSIAIYGIDGNLMDEAQIQNLCLSVQSEKNPNFNLNTDHMKKIILSMAALFALGFKDSPADGHDASDIETKVLDLASQNKALKDENETLKLAAQTAADAKAADAKARITTKVELGITQGKFGADKKDEMILLGLASETALDTVIGAIAPKANFTAGVVVPGGNGMVDVKTLDEFEALPQDVQLTFKNDNPEEYKKLVS
jgi:Caudovirus prohead serine protease